MKRTCEGCKAFDTDGYFVKCDLGYKQEKIFMPVFYVLAASSDRWFGSRDGGYLLAVKARKGYHGNE